MFPSINLGPLVLPTGSLLTLLGAWLSLSVAERAARRLGLDEAAVYGLSVAVFLAGAAGARLTFVAQYWSAYRQNPVTILWPLNSGFNLWGGLLAAGLTAVFYGRHRRLPPWPTLDAVAPALLTLLVAVSLADFLAGPGFGTLTNLPWGITQFGVRRHPVQLYEIGVGLIALAAWWGMRRAAGPAGQRFLVAIAVYCGGRLFVDAFRENAWLAANGIHLLQVICLAGMLAALFWLGQRADRAGSAGQG